MCAFCQQWKKHRSTAPSPSSRPHLRHALQFILTQQGMRASTMRMRWAAVDVVGAVPALAGAPAPLTDPEATAMLRVVDEARSSEKWRFHDLSWHHLPRPSVASPE